MKTLVKMSTLMLGIVSLTACDWFSSDGSQAQKKKDMPIDTAIHAAIPDSSTKAVTVAQPDSGSTEKAQ